MSLIDNSRLTMNTEQDIRDLVATIDAATERGSVTNTMVARVLSWLLERFIAMGEDIEETYVTADDVEDDEVTDLPGLSAVTLTEEQYVSLPGKEDHIIYVIKKTPTT